MIRGALRGRAVGIAAAAWVTTCTVAFLVALLTSAPLPAAGVVVVAPRALPSSGGFAVRVHAVREGQAGLRDVAGTVALGDETVPLAGGVARFFGQTAGAPKPLVFRLDVRIDGEPQELTATLDPQEAGSAAAPQRSAWEAEVLMQAGRAQQNGPAVYPLDGRVPSRLAAAVLLVDAAGAVIHHDLAPDAAGPQLPDGRRLRVDRGNVRIAAARALPVGAHAITLTTAEPRLLALDVIARGVLLDSHLVHVEGSATVEVTVPSTLAAGTPITLRAAEPLADGAVAHHLSCATGPPAVPKPAAPNAEARASDERALACLLGWAERAPRAGPDPLLTALRARLQAAQPIDGDAVQALGARLSVQSDTPTRIRAVPVERRGVGFWARALFAAAAVIGVVATVLAAAWRHPSPTGGAGRSVLDRLLLVAVVAALLGGLGLILVLTA